MLVSKLQNNAGVKVTTQGSKKKIDVENGMSTSICFHDFTISVYSIKQVSQKNER